MGVIMNNSTIEATEARGVSMDTPFFSETPEFDTSYLTPKLKEYVMELSKCTDAPDAFIISALLGYWAGVVGNKLILDDLRPNIWIAVFAGSSISRKSTALRLGGIPFRNVQKSFKEGDKIILSSDFSDAGFFQMMQNNTLAGTIVATEFSDFHKKLNRDYTGMGEAFLSAYDNERMMHITRSFGEEIIDEPTFSILGATTLEGFKNVFGGSEQENGFLQRFIPIITLNNDKDRILYLKRKQPDDGIILEVENRIRSWLAIEKANVHLSDEIIDYHGKWELEMIENAKSKYGNKIMSFVERQIVNCIKLSMLIESFEQEYIENKQVLEISYQSMICSMQLLQQLIMPSLFYLLEHEIVYDFQLKRLNKLLDVISQNNCISKTDLRNKISSKHRKFLDNDIQLLKEGIYIKESYSYDGKRETFYSMNVDR